MESGEGAEVGGCRGGGDHGLGLHLDCWDVVEELRRRKSIALVPLEEGRRMKDDELRSEVIQIECGDERWRKVCEESLVGSGVSQGIGRKREIRVLFELTEKSLTSLGV